MVCVVTALRGSKLYKSWTVSGHLPCLPLTVTTPELGVYQQHVHPPPPPPLSTDLSNNLPMPGTRRSHLHHSGHYETGVKLHRQT